MSPNTSMEPLNRFEGSAENSIETVSDQSVPVNLVSPPAAESCHAQTTDEVAPFAIEFFLWDRRFDCTTSQVWATPITWGGPYHQSRGQGPRVQT